MLNRSSAKIGARVVFALTACFTLAACADGSPEDATDDTPREQPVGARPIISDSEGVTCGAEICAFPRSVEPTPDAFVAWYSAEFLPDEYHSLELERELGDFLPGSTVHRYAHFYRGVQVDGEGLGLTVREGLVTGAVGKVTPRIEASVRPSVSEGAAILAGQAAAGREARFASHGHSCALHLRLGTDAEPSLRYVCNLIGAGPHGGYTATVDAMTGEALGVRANALFNDWDVAPATAQTGWHGPQQVHVKRHLPTNTYYLEGPLATVFDGVPGVAYESTTGIFGLDQKEGGAAYWGAERTLDYLLSTWGMVPSTHLRIVSNLLNVPNALYVPENDTLWFGATSSPVLSLTALDTVAHEIGHKVAYDTGLLSVGATPANPIYGAVHESFADIVGELTEQHVLGAADWIHGNLYAPHYTQRNFANPHASKNPKQPDVLFGTNYSYSLDDIHQDSSIPSLWFARLAGVANGSGQTSLENAPALQFSYNVEPIGQKSAFLIFVRMLQLMKAGADEYNPFVVSTTAAREFCGAGSQERISVHNAWHSVIGPAITPITIATYANPGSGDTNVHPWPARLSWQALVGAYMEAVWEVQISPDSTFPPESTQTLTTADTDFENNLIVGFAEFFLDSDTPYYWRVRITDGDPNFECWRPVNTFTTGNAAPIPFSPIGGNIHPWSIPFSYSHQEGVTFYEIEVSESGNQISAPGDPANHGRFATPAFPPQIIPAQPSSDQSAEITVPKNKKLMWHVRGIYKKDGQPTQYSGWSTPMPFQTKQPAVTLLAPADGSWVYPWPVQHLWNPLSGAEFTVHSTFVGLSTPQPELSEVVGDAIYVNRFYAPYPVSANRGAQWRVNAKGPPFGSKLTPESDNTRESATPSPTWAWWNHGDSTVPTGFTGPSGCQEWGSSHTLHWAPVSGATHYSLTTPDQEFSVYATSASIALLHAPGGLAAYRVAAMHDGLKGVGSASLSVPVRPTKPHLNAVYPDADEPGEIDFDWVTSYAYADTFEVEVFEGTSCGGPVVHGNTLHIPPDVPGGTAYGASLAGFKDGTFSMKIRSVDNPSCGAPSPWSNCLAFQHVNPRPFEIVAFNDPLQLTFNGSAQPTYITYDAYPPPQFPLTVVVEPAGSWSAEWEQHGGGTTISNPQNPLVIWGWCAGYGVLWPGGSSDWVTFPWHIYLKDANGLTTQVITHTHKCWKPDLGPG